MVFAINRKLHSTGKFSARFNSKHQHETTEGLYASKHESSRNLCARLQQLCFFPVMVLLPWLQVNTRHRSFYKCSWINDDVCEKDKNSVDTCVGSPPNGSVSDNAKLLIRKCYQIDCEIDFCETQKTWIDGQKESNKDPIGILWEAVTTFRNSFLFSCMLPAPQFTDEIWNTRQVACFIRLSSVASSTSARIPFNRIFAFHFSTVDSTPTCETIYLCKSQIVLCFVYVFSVFVSFNNFGSVRASLIAQML